jgi:Helix-turn-helix domain
MPYPARPHHDPLSQFAGTRGQWLPPGGTAELTKYVVREYAQGRSLRELAELTDRSWSEVRKILAAAGVRRRPAGAQRISSRAGQLWKARGQAEQRPIRLCAQAIVRDASRLTAG